MYRLKELRMAKGVSGSEIARFLGVTRQAYGNYERGERKVPQDKLKLLATYFQVSVDDIIDYDSGASMIVYLDPPECSGITREAMYVMNKLPENRQKQYLRRMQEDLDFLNIK